MSNKFFYFDSPEEYEAGCKKAIAMLRVAGFNEEVLVKEIEDSKRDYGDEFFWTIAMSRDGKRLLEEWKAKKNLGDKRTAQDFVMRCTYDGD